MTNTSKRRFSYKLDLIFWLIISLLPIFFYLAVNYRNPGAVGFFDYMDSFSPFPFISEVLDSVAETAFGAPFALSGLLSYFVGVEIFHILFDVIVFIPRLAHKWISKAVQDE